MGFHISPAPFDPVTAAYDREIRDLQEKIAMLEDARTDYLNGKIEQRELDAAGATAGRPARNATTPNERDMMIERLR